jgi:hypothetical protein
VLYSFIMANKKKSRNRKLPFRSSKSDIMKLQNAVDELGNFIPKKGDKVIIQFPESWRATELFVVVAIEPETGNVRLWDGGLYRCTNFKTGPERGLVIKIPPVSK